MFGGLKQKCSSSGVIPTFGSIHHERMRRISGITGFSQGFIILGCLRLDISNPTQTEEQPVFALDVSPDRRRPHRLSFLCLVSKTPTCSEAAGILEQISPPSCTISCSLLCRGVWDLVLKFSTSQEENFSGFMLTTHIRTSTPCILMRVFLDRKSVV